MAERGLVDIILFAFRGIDLMLTGNNCTHNFRALRLLVETVIQNTIHEANDDDGLISRLQHHARSSIIAKFWADGLMKPVFLMMISCQAEKEADWPLYVCAVCPMIPYQCGQSSGNWRDDHENVGPILANRLQCSNQ